MTDHIPLKRASGTRKQHDRTVRTICGECSLGCGLSVYVQNGQIADIHGDEENPVNRGRLCAKGIGFIQSLSSPERLRYPEYRKSTDDAFEFLPGWDAAFDMITEQLRRISGRYGSRSLMIACDPEAGLDFFIGAMRFAGLWGTPYVFHPAMNPKACPGAPRYPRPERPASDWLNSQCLFLIEADLAATHPAAFRHITEARERGIKIIAADSRFTATMSKADIALMISPETGNLLGLALMKILLEEGLVNPEQASAVIDDFQGWKASFDAMTADGLKESLLIGPESLRAVGRLLGKHGPATLITGRRLAKQASSGIWLTMSKAMGWDKKPGGGWYPLDAGTPEFNALAGIDDQNDSPDDGAADHPTLIRQIREAMNEPDPQIRAIICSGNCLNDFMADIRDIVPKLELVIYFGAFPNVTRDFAHVSLPAALWSEQDRLCCTNDGTEAWGGKIAEPSEGCRTGLDFWTGLAKRFGDVKRLAWEQYFNWKLENGRADHDAFYRWLKENKAPLAKRFAPEYAPPRIAPAPVRDENFPFTFQRTRISSRPEGTHRRRLWTEDLEREDAVHIHPDAAKRLLIKNGDDVIVSSPSGMFEGRAVITRMVPESLIWSPKRMGDKQVNVCRKED